ncbi:MAG: hypothetical protein ACE5I3_11450 [Phycisphaerae bacterium]
MTIGAKEYRRDGCHGQALPAREPSRACGTPPSTTASDSREWRLLALAVLLPLLAAILLFKLNVPLGKPGKFVYLYSPIVSQRLAALPSALLLAALLGGGVWLAFSGRKWRCRAGFFLVTLGCMGGAGWAFFAPPSFRSQHFFNMQSPSHDGAFLTEASYVRRLGVRSYLPHFPRRAQAPPEEMRGTRVLSNPPATTLLAVGVISLMERSPRLTRALHALGTDQDLPPEAALLVTVSTGFACALLLPWLLAAPFVYGSGRLFLSPPSALAFALVCLFSPMTLLFSPGKDPAQLLTVALPLWLWLLAWRRRRSWAAALAGGAFVLACLVSLVHVWVATVVCVATFLGTSAEQRGRFILRTGLPALCGMLAAIGALALFAGLDFFATAWSVAGSQAQVTRGDNAMPFVWQLLGVPLFVLFAGPALWSVGLWLPLRRLRDAEARFGFYLLLGSVVVMLATVGFTNLETPRLWIPFTPLLLLGPALQLPAFRQPTKRLAVLLATLVFLQFSAAAAQWSLMDMREAETRLLQRQDGGARFFH